MQKIELSPLKADLKTFSFLEECGLIRLLKPTKKSFTYRDNGCLVEKIYETNPSFGTHKLICVTLNTQEINLNFHPDNEDFILIKSNHHIFKPLYLILALDKYKNLEKKIKEKNLSSKDFIALELKYNHSDLSVFTLLKDTVHSEVTTDGKGKPPIFFVTEPSKLTAEEINLGEYKLFLKRRTDWTKKK